MKRLPVHCKTIVMWDDHRILEALLKFIPIPTEEFFYGKCYPMFKSLYTRYYTDCKEDVEFIDEIYLNIMKPNPVSLKCKLELFQFRCALHNWVGVISLRYCYAKYKTKVQEESLDEGEIFDGDPQSIYAEMHIMEKEDVLKILEMMPNDRYREIIRLRYLEDYSNEETAAKLGLEMSNYYNKHLLAKAQYIAVYKKEMGL